MFEKIKKIIINTIENHPDYIELKKKLIKLKTDLKKEIKELHKELNERNDSRKKKFFRELFYAIIIGFVLWFSLTIFLIHLGYNDVTPFTQENDRFLNDALNLEKREWGKQYYLNHDNENDMRRLAAYIYKILTKKDSDIPNDIYVKKCLDLWRLKMIKWDKEFIIFKLPFETKLEEQYQKILKQKMFLKKARDFYKFLKNRQQYRQNRRRR